MALDYSIPRFSCRSKLDIIQIPLFPALEISENQMLLASQSPKFCRMVQLALINLVVH